MTEEKQVNQNEKDQEAQSTAESQKTEQEHMIPKDRLDQEINRRKQLEEQLAASQKTAKEAEEKRLEEQEQWRELAEKRQEELAALQPKAAVAEEQEKSLSAYLKAQVEEIPEDMRSLIPEQLTTLQKLDWLAVNRSKLLKPIGPDIGAGQRGAGSGGSSVELTAEQKAVADKFGYTAEEYIKYMDAQ
jgi:hypothetical protein